MVDELVVVSESKLRSILAEAVASVLEERLPNALREIERPYLTTDEAAAMSGLSKRSLMHLRSTGQLNFTRSGKRKILIARADLIEYLESRKIKARGSRP
jgi:excisionase family DNA binding protein